MKIGNILRKLRSTKKLSQQEVAERVGVCQSTYFAWENDRATPNAKYYVRLAVAFGVEPKELLPDDLTVLVSSPYETKPSALVLVDQSICDELVASQRQVIHLQQQRIEQLEVENCQLWERLKQLPNVMADSLSFIR